MTKTGGHLTAKLTPCPEGGFMAVCAEIEGARSQGETEKEALENLMDAISGVLAVRAEIALEQAQSKSKAKSKTGRVSRTIRFFNFNEATRPAKTLAPARV